jgi:hypothetical protein
MDGTGILGVGRIVRTDGGPVTLCELGVLKSELIRLETETNSARDKSESLSSLAHSKLIECGHSIFDAYRNGTAPAALQPLVQAATPLANEIDTEGAEINALHETPHHGLGGVLAKLGDSRREHTVSAQLASTQSKLEPILIELARQAIEFPNPDTAAIHAQAAAADKEAADAATELTMLSNAAAAARDEIARRDQAIKDLGFDAPYTAAYFTTYGAPDVHSPLVLKRGEQAALSVSATLARQRTRTQYVGGSSGFSFPIGHTGIRYRVGSYHGHPVEQQYLAHIDTGQLVVTNQRVAFVGGTKSSSVPLERLLHVECYKDAVAIFKEGRENADFYLVVQPQYVLFVVNWVLSKKP